MMTALNALSKAANDAQQRGWALHDDAHDIQTQLLELISVMVKYSSVRLRYEVILKVRELLWATY